MKRDIIKIKLNNTAEESKSPLSCTCLLGPVTPLKSITLVLIGVTVTKVCAVRRGPAAFHPNSSPKNENSFCAYSPSFTNLRSDPTQ